MNIAQGQRQRPSSQMLGRVRLHCGDHLKEGAPHWYPAPCQSPAQTLPHWDTAMNAQPQLGSQGTRPWAGGAASGGCETGLQLGEYAPSPL